MIIAGDIGGTKTNVALFEVGDGRVGEPLAQHSYPSARFDSLARVEKIVIEYDPPDRSREQLAPKALLALGWVASRLGWEVAPGGAAFDGGRAQFVL